MYIYILSKQTARYPVFYYERPFLANKKATHPAALEAGDYSLHTVKSGRRLPLAE
jgi:hypothetical protein